MTDPRPSEDADNTAKRKRLLTLLGLTVVALALIALLYWVFWGRLHQSTEDAYVGGNITPVSARIAGTVVSIHADDTDLVKTGSLLIQLDDADTQLALDEARASLAQTLREVQSLYAQTEQLKTSWQQAQKDYERVRKLEQNHSVSTQELQHAKVALDNARAGYDAALARTQGTTPTTHPQVLLAIARLKTAWLAEERTHIRAPVTGYVAQRQVQLGQKVQPGTPLLAIVPLDHLWVDANFKETEIRNIRIGQSAEVETDLYGSAHTYHGKVVGLAAGTGSAFALLPPQNATGNWIKVVQRLPVRISLDPKELEAHPLRIGLSTQVTVNTSDRDGAILAQAPISTARYHTDIYQQQNDKLQQLIDQIIAANKVATP